MYTMLGTSMVAASVIVSSCVMFRGCFERAAYLSQLAGISRGMSAVLLGLTIVAQLLSCAAIVLHPLYSVVGTMFPSSVLAAAVLLEAAMFGDSSSYSDACRCACVTCALFLISVFRCDPKARRNSQVPTSDVFLTLETGIRRACTTAHAGLFLPPLALATFALALRNSAFWKGDVLFFEWQLQRFQLRIGASALMLLLSALDTEKRLQNASRTVLQWARRLSALARKRVHKKSL